MKTSFQKSLLAKNPKLAEEWHPTKNEHIKSNMIMANSNRRYWWHGKCGHEWKAQVNSRNQGYGCPFCSGHRVLQGYNDLEATNPKLAKEWHPKLNEPLTPQEVSVGSEKNVWWIGKCGHVFTARINNRNNGKGCPYCAGQKVLVGFNDFETAFPNLVKEWHPTKNDLNPTDVSRGSNKKVWWLCKFGHEYQASISARTRGQGCPACVGRKKGWDFYEYKK
ncbi:MAG: zinc-ribbon domain-containing protein [Firmicutes bacterium]|nr:zinc-ribbon domain-containing protein [Bacillota bacterium]